MKWGHESSLPLSSILNAGDTAYIRHLSRAHTCPFKLLSIRVQVNETMKKWASMSTIISLQDLQIFTLPLCKTDTKLHYTNLSTPSTTQKLVFT